MLYLVATPIGNLEDITHRAVRVLGEVDVILCEDTRHSRKLLDHYGISKPLLSFHKLNEMARTRDVVAELKAGKQFALLADAGTPGIADPGVRLVRACREEGLAVTALPGPCALIEALSLSGFEASRFQFVGFLPKKMGPLKSALIDGLSYAGTTICFESPLRLASTLEMLGRLDADCQAGVAREMTKRFEELLWGQPAKLLSQLANPPKGEIVLLIQGKPNQTTRWLAMTPKEHVAWLQKEYSLERAEALKLAASLRGVPKRNLYREIHGETP